MAQKRKTLNTLYVVVALKPANTHLKGSLHGEHARICEVLTADGVVMLDQMSNLPLLGTLVYSTTELLSLKVTSGNINAQEA